MKIIIHSNTLTHVKKDFLVQGKWYTAINHSPLLIYHRYVSKEIYFKSINDSENLGGRTEE